MFGLGRTLTVIQWPHTTAPDQIWQDTHPGRPPPNIPQTVKYLILCHTYLTSQVRIITKNLHPAQAAAWRTQRTRQVTRPLFSGLYRKLTSMTCLDNHNVTQHDVVRIQNHNFVQGIHQALSPNKLTSEMCNITIIL